MMKENNQLIKDQVVFHKNFDYIDICLVIQYKVSNSFSLLPHSQPAVLWRQF